MAREGEEWQTLEIHVGDELEFDVFRLDSDSAGVFCIRGKLSTTSLQLKHSAVSEDVAETVVEEVVEKTPKKKKKKKDKDTDTCGTVDSVTEVADVTDVTPQEETDIPCSDHNKKKKKRKHSEEANFESPKKRQ